eukprot:1357677-Rhodomonas_salina.1
MGEVAMGVEVKRGGPCVSWRAPGTCLMQDQVISRRTERSRDKNRSVALLRRVTFLCLCDRRALQSRAPARSVSLQSRPER